MGKEIQESWYLISHLTEHHGVVVFQLWNLNHPEACLTWFDDYRTLHIVAAEDELAMKVTLYTIFAFRFRLIDGCRTQVL